MWYFSKRASKRSKIFSSHEKEYMVNAPESESIRETNHELPPLSLSRMPFSIRNVGTTTTITSSFYEYGSHYRIADTAALCHDFSVSCLQLRLPAYIRFWRISGRGVSCLSHTHRYCRLSPRRSRGPPPEGLFPRFHGPPMMRSRFP